MLWVFLFPAMVVGQGKNPVKSQVKDTLIFKGVNKIFVENNLQINQNIFLLQTALSRRGYDVIINRKQFMVSTKDSVIDNRSCAYVFNGLIVPGGIELSGKYNQAVASSAMGEKGRVFKYDMAYSNSDNGSSKKLFALLVEIAGDIQGKKIYINETRKKKGAIF